MCETGKNGVCVCVCERERGRECRHTGESGNEGEQEYYEE